MQIYEKSCGVFPRFLLTLNIENKGSFRGKNIQSHPSQNKTLSLDKMIDVTRKQLHANELAGISFKWNSNELT